MYVRLSENAHDENLQQNFRRHTLLATLHHCIHLAHCQQYKVFVSVSKIIYMSECHWLENLCTLVENQNLRHSYFPSRTCHHTIRLHKHVDDDLGYRNHNLEAHFTSNMLLKEKRKALLVAIILVSLERAFITAQIYHRINFHFSSTLAMNTTFVATSYPSKICVHTVQDEHLF